MESEALFKFLELLIRTQLTQVDYQHEGLKGPEHCSPDY